MKINNSMMHNFGGFALDINTIDYTTADAQNIVLPYLGQLPNGVPDQSATICMIVKPFDVRITLQTIEKGKTRRYPLSAEREEIAAIMDSFFFKSAGSTRFDTGLSDYWLGIWQATILTGRKRSNNKDQRSAQRPWALLLF